MEDTLSALLEPTRSMYGAARAEPSSLPAVQDPPKPPPPSGLTLLAGVAVATGVTAGASALVGRLLYPDVKTRRFASVSALAYAVPTVVFLAFRNKNTRG